MGTCEGDFAASLFIESLHLLVPIVAKLIENGTKSIDLTLVGKCEDDYINTDNIKHVLEGYIPENVSFTVRHVEDKLDAEGTIDYIVTGEHEDTLQDRNEINTLLTDKGVAYKYVNTITDGTAVKRITKKKEKKLWLKKPTLSGTIDNLGEYLYYNRHYIEDIPKNKKISAILKNSK